MVNKQRDLDMLNERLRKYQAHNEELEKECEFMNKQRLEWEREIIEVKRDKDLIRKQATELQH